MSGWTDIFLGVIAATTLVTAIIQIGVLVAAGRLAMRESASKLAMLSIGIRASQT